MQYAVVLEFDEASKTYMQTLLKTAATAADNAYMRTNGIAPHLTLALFDTTDEAAAFAVANTLLQQANRLKIPVSALSAFVPHVLFLSPAATPALLALNQIAFQATQAAAATPDSYYYPQTWVPHIALAVQLDLPALQKAFSAVSEQFWQCIATATTLSLVRCNPYKNIKSWQLGD